MVEGEDDEDVDPLDNAASRVHEWFRCSRGEDTRIYQLRPVPGGAELWRVEVRPGEEPNTVKESDSKGSEEAAAFLEELRRALKAGGWR